MTDDYAGRRREYVESVRKSFAEDTPYVGKNQEEQRGEGVNFFKIRLFLAVCLLGIFLYCHCTDTKIFQYTPEEIVELLSDDHYYSKLKDYFM